jgi:hypothetical protein
MAIRVEIRGGPRISLALNPGHDDVAGCCDAGGGSDRPKEKGPERRGQGWEETPT